MKITVEKVDALEYVADMLVVKFAQALYGVDYAVVERLFGDYVSCEVSIPQGEIQIVDTSGKMGIRQVMFIGVGVLYHFGYQEIRQFCCAALQHLQQQNLPVKHLCFTLHGAGYGLSESKAFLAELLGIQDALKSDKAPSCLEKISFIERDSDRFELLYDILCKVAPSGDFCVSTVLQLPGSVES